MQQLSPQAEWEIWERHSKLFIELALAMTSMASLDDLDDLSAKPAIALDPVLIEDFRALTTKNREELCAAFHSRHGVAYFVVLNPDTSPSHTHPLFDICDQLSDAFHLTFPLPHPLEGHREAVDRFGPTDGTVKIYDLSGKGGMAGYREQAETNETFDFHHDGLGSGGTVETAVLYMDSAPLVGGFTYFQNIILVSLALAKHDPSAFTSLFLPDALTIIRPRGKGAIKVQTPVIFVNEARKPQAFFRTSSGEYRVFWRAAMPHLVRARAFFERFVPPFSNGAAFVHLSGKGHGILINNQIVAHARTPFIDAPSRGLTRVLSRKWFMRTARDAVYKHVPGMFLYSEFAVSFPALCAPAVLEGEWLYDVTSDANTQKTK
jgi:hypothetical protein